MKGQLSGRRLLVGLLALSVSVGVGVLPRAAAASGPLAEPIQARRLGGVTTEAASWPRGLASVVQRVRAQALSVPALAAGDALRGTSWTQQAELTSTAQTLNDGYGSAVALSGNTAVIGAQNTPPWPSPAYGAVYIFTRTTTGTWVQQAELLDPQYGSGQDHFFGDALALQGNVLVVGAFGATGVTTDTGAAFVYVRTGSTWTLQATLRAADGAYIDGFGAAVALWGSTIVIGAPGKNNGEGAAYVFAYTSQSWVQQAEFAYPGQYLFAQFGFRVALWGTTALVSAPEAPVAFVYTRNGTTWTLQAVLSAPHSPALFFGQAIALWGDTALVSAYNFYTPINGAVYIFTRSGTTWSLQATLGPPGGAQDDIYGTAVGLSYHTAVVTGGAGAFIYAGSGATWTLQTQLIPTDRPPNQIGATAALQGNTALIGATGVPPAGYVFVRSGADWTGATDALGQERSVSSSHPLGRAGTTPAA